MFQPKFTARDVDSLLHAYWLTQSERMQGIERDLVSRAADIHMTQYLTKDDFWLVCSWTAPPARRWYENNTEQVIHETTARAFHAKSERHRIDSLTELKGVAYPIASTILHFFHPDPYPILSSPALWSLGVEADPPYHFDFWLEYTQYFRQLVAEWSVTPRDLDRALWQYHNKMYAQ